MFEGSIGGHDGGDIQPRVIPVERAKMWWGTDEDPWLLKQDCLPLDCSAFDQWECRSGEAYEDPRCGEPKTVVPRIPDFRLNMRKRERQDFDRWDA